MGKAPTHFLYDLLLVILFTYGIFYTSYKFGRPDLGNHDFVKYEKMVDSPLNLSTTRAPFVLRQLPTVVAYGIRQAGIYYPNKTSFADSVYYKGEDSQRTLFALIFSNYLAVVIGLTILIRYVRKHQPENHHAHFIILALCLGYFMLQLNVIAPLTQGYGWLATILLAMGLFDRKYLPLLAGTCIALFSRETVILFFIAFSTGYAFYERKEKVSLVFTRNTLFILSGSLLLLLLLRIGFTHGNAAQFSLIHLISETFKATATPDYWFQAFFSQGLLIYILIGFYRDSRPLALIYMVALLLIILISGFGVGRIIGESYPLLVLLYCLSKSGNRAFTHS